MGNAVHYFRTQIELIRSYILTPSRTNPTIIQYYYDLFSMFWGH